MSRFDVNIFLSLFTWKRCISSKNNFYEDDRVIILSFDEFETDSVLIPFVFKLAGLSSFSPLFPLPARLLTIFLVSFIVIAET